MMRAELPNGHMGDFIHTSVLYYALAAGGGRSGKAPVSRAQAPAAPVPVVEEDGGKFKRNQKDVAELCKRRFFYRQAFDIYGGVAGFYTYGPPGSALKSNLIQQWRKHFVIEEALLEIEDTCIMQHQVLKASGHVDRFNDFIVKDVKDPSHFFRADKLLEEIMEKKLEEPGITEAQKKEFTVVMNQADAYSREEMMEVFARYKIKSPDSGNDLTDPEDFNLMFPTPIGPGGYLQGYLRPETAQGIFLNYKFCLEQNGNRIPFGVAQVGKAFRNEIAPRAGLTRQREFTQAEIEYFVDPTNKRHPKFERVSDLELCLFPSPQQLAGEAPIKTTLGRAVAEGTVNNETLGYMIGRTHAFLVGAGISPAHLRFRQHLPTEMAHYATDCWDAEINTCYGWLECVGIADRACFDLNAHATASNSDLRYKENLETPIEQEVLAISKEVEKNVMKHFKKDGKAVKDWILALHDEDRRCLHADLTRDGAKEVEVGEKTFELTRDLVQFEKKIEKVTTRAFTPGVVEPSFGIDRILFSMLEHAYYARPSDPDSADSQTRGVLSLAPSVAPYKCTVLPLSTAVTRDPKYAVICRALRRSLASCSLSYTLDESGASIGKRYARNDELGIPFAVTIDFDTLTDGVLTLRIRDPMDQAKMQVDEVVEKVFDLCTGSTTWESILARYTHRRGEEEEWTVRP